MKTIGYVSTSNPFTDRKVWSGTIYKTRESIEKAGFKIKWVKVCPPKIHITFLKTILKIQYGFTMHHPWLFKTLAKYTDWATAAECDILFFPGNAQIMKYAPISKEYVYFTDACFNQMVNYYWHNLNKSHIKLANREEKWAINNAKVNIRASDWAKSCAIDFYKDNPDKNHVVEFGANIDDTDIVESSVFSSGKLNIFFSGVDWNRKGGDIAVEAVTILREEYGIDAVLSIAGIRELPRKYQSLNYIKNLGFLNKNTPEQYMKYINAIKESHLMLLPTKAECAGIVFCEASAYGLPTFTHDTGGVGNYVINGINGYRLPLGSTSADFAKKIYDAIQTNKLSDLHCKAIQLYHQKLNWNIWSDRFKHIIDNISIL